MQDPSHPLRKWRLGQDPAVTLDTLAKRLGVRASHLSQVERGIRGVSMDLAAKIERETGIPMNALVKAAA
jgi:transcriptional regulator with XRE-family HTH domain